MKGWKRCIETLEPKGLTVLGFPCNQFGTQEPGGADEIGAFCQKNYGVSFPMFEKIDVNGENAHPLYKFLTRAKRGLFGTPTIKWNFTKFLIGRDGVPVKRFAPDQNRSTAGIMEPADPGDLLVRRRHGSGSRPCTAPAKVSSSA